MPKKPKRPLGRRLRRNPVARELAEPKYRARVVKSKDGYKRRPRHKKPPGDEGGES